MADVRVIVADDSAVVRAGVEAILELEAGARVLASVGSIRELDSAVAACFTTTGDRDVVVTDIRMPPTHTDEGIEAAVRLRDSHPWVGVVVLSQVADPTYLNRLLSGGAAGRGYLLKDHVGDPGELVTALQAVAAGGSFVDRHVAGLLVQRRARAAASPLDGLTPREREILAAVATGRSNIAIAEALHIGHRAVEKHINSIFAKLGLHDDPDVNRRVRAVLTFLQAGGRPAA